MRALHIRFAIAAAIIAGSFGTPVLSRPRQTDRRTEFLEQRLVRREGGKFSFGPKVLFRVNQLSPADARVAIDCRGKCSARFEEQVPGSALGVFVIGSYEDGDLNLTTVWEGATNILVRVYHVTSSSVRVVLESTGKSWPRFGVDPQQREEVIIPGMIDVGGGETFPKAETVWRWDGTTFVPEQRTYAAFDRGT